MHSAIDEAFERKGIAVHANSFAEERRTAIVRLVSEGGKVRVGQLANRFAVSAVTIRKDLDLLESHGQLVRTHGGAFVPQRPDPELAFDLRRRLQRQEKAGIAAAAVELVGDGDSIAIDASTTALELARLLRARRGWSQLTVITNGLRLASELAGSSGISVLLAGGRVRWEAMSVVGQLGDGLFARVNVQTAFLGAAGFTLESGLSDATDEEAQIKRSMVSAARRVVALVDHTKWERTAVATFSKTSEIDDVITDVAAPAGMVEDLRQRGVRVILVSGTKG
jgi:DeoR/GlpR family transcriptional regulator of sugar metabolism